MRTLLAPTNAYARYCFLSLDMAACRIQPNGGCLFPKPGTTVSRKLWGRSPTVAVLVRAADGGEARVLKETRMTKPAEIKMEGAATDWRTSRVYDDNWLEMLAINYLSKCFQEAAGVRIGKSGYESLVDAARIVSQKFDPEQQMEIVIDSLRKAIPGLILNLVRALLPQSQFTREYFAAFTTIFFAWLVGPSEVRESELNGIKEKNVVHITKCRFLEQSNCAGMCTNLCKMPSQAFIKDFFGMPVNMVPNFEDMTCQMIYGQDPPSQADDPAFTQPCYKLCKNLDLTSKLVISITFILQYEEKARYEMFYLMQMNLKAVWSSSLWQVP